MGSLMLIATVSEGIKVIDECIATSGADTVASSQ
jgi:hypothetical protein